MGKERGVLTALGGLPLFAAQATKHIPNTVVRQKPIKTSRDELMQLLRRKSWQVEDLEKHPMVLGVPLGQDGGSQRGVSVDIGLKEHATVGLSEIVDASPDLKRALMQRALDDPEGSGPVDHNDLLRKKATVPMAVHTKEDLLSMPVASPVHPSALQSRLPDEKLDLLLDPFFRANPPSGELVDLVVEGVPGADKHVAARDEHRREQRAAIANEWNATGGRNR